jgi:hypothetical protein
MVEQCGELRYTDPLDKLSGTQAYRHGPSPRERMAEQRRLETPAPSWDQIDERIQAFLANERQRYEQLVEAKCEEVGEFWREVCARAIAEALDKAEQRPGPQGPPGPAGKLSSIREWKFEQVSYANQVFAYEGACYQALPRYRAGARWHRLGADRARRSRWHHPAVTWHLRSEGELQAL